MGDEAADVTPLWRWMREKRVTLGELATRVGVTPEYLSNVRRGVNRPSDELKWKLEDATKAIEVERGFANPTGVTCAAWFEKRPVTA